MTESGYELAFQDHDDYLSVEISGAYDSLQRSLAYWQEIADECERRGVRSLLVIDRFGGDPIAPQEMDRVIHALRDSYMQRVRVAYCKLNPAFLPQAEYGELSAREAGYVTRVFGGEREAELWLRYGQS